MRRYINLDTLGWQERADVAIPLNSLSVKARTKLVLELQFVRDGVPELLPPDTTLLFGAKEQGKYDADYLASQATWTIPTDADDFYVVEVDFATSAVDDLLEANGDPSDDIALEEIMGEVEWVPGGAGAPIKTQTVPIVLHNAVIRGDEAFPSAANPLGEEVARFFKTITGYSGGTSADLDSVETVGRAYGLVAFRHSGGTLKFYQLTAGTDAESAPNVIRPDDFHATTNAFVWKLQDVGAGVSAGGGLTVVSPISASATLAANTTGIVNVAGATNVTLTLPTGADNDRIHRRVVIASGASATVSVSGALEAVSYTATGAAAEVQLQLGKRAAGWEVLEKIVYVDSGGGGASVPGAPTIGTATATGSTTATVAFTAPGSNGGATITSYTATSSPGGITGTLSQAGSGTITVSGLTASTAYTFTVTATNSAGTSSASAASNSITTNASGGVPAAVTFGLDATLLSYANDTPIDNGSNKWTDFRGSNHAAQATANLRPLVKTGAAEAGGRAILFADTLTEEDFLTLTTPIALAGAFSILLKVKSTKRGGVLISDASGNGYFPAIGSDDAVLSPTSGDSDVIDDPVTITSPGSYHLGAGAGPSGTFWNDGVAGTATFTTTVNSSGQVVSVTIGGTNSGYNGVITAVFATTGRAKLIMGTSEPFASSTPSVANIADGSYHALEVHRNGSDLVEFFVDGTALGTATLAGTLTLGRLGQYIAGHVEKVLVSPATRLTGPDLTDARTYLG